MGKRARTPRRSRTWKCWLLGHKFKYDDHALRTHVVDFCLRCGMVHD